MLCELTSAIPSVPQFPVCKKKRSAFIFSPVSAHHKNSYYIYQLNGKFFKQIPQPCDLSF